MKRRRRERYELVDMGFRVHGLHQWKEGTPELVQALELRKQLEERFHPMDGELISWPVESPSNSNVDFVCTPVVLVSLRQGVESPPRWEAMARVRWSVAQERYEVLERYGGQVLFTASSVGRLLDQLVRRLRAIEAAQRLCGKRYG